MAASTELKPKDVVNALQTLEDNQLKELFYHLEVPLPSLNSICAQNTGNMRRINYVETWFNNDVKASWEKIVAGLEHIKMNALAHKLALQCGIRSAPTSTAIATSPDFMESPPVTTGLRTCTTPSSLTTSRPLTAVRARRRARARPLDPMTCTPSSSLVSSDRVSQVRANIEQLVDSFADRLFETQIEMCKKESCDTTFLDKFRCHLLALPVAKKATHVKFFRESEDDFLEAKNMRKIFAILTRYCTYRNYEIIQHVVKKFCEAMLQWKMQQYCQALESFEKATTVDIYLLAISACKELSLAFTRMTMKINKPPSICTLHEVRKVNEAIAERASLQSYAVYIESVMQSSVLVAVQFPSSCLGWVLAALTPDFLHAHLLSDVAVSGEKITIQQISQEELVCV